MCLGGTEILTLVEVVIVYNTYQCQTQPSADYNEAFPLSMVDYLEGGL